MTPLPLYFFPASNHKSKLSWCDLAWQEAETSAGTVFDPRHHAGTPPKSGCWNTGLRQRDQGHALFFSASQMPQEASP